MKARIRMRPHLKRRMPKRRPRQRRPLSDKLTDKLSDKPSPAPRLPGDRSERQERERILRVDHAGEFGAKRIYEGQLAILGEKPVASLIREMAAEEEEHLAFFDGALKREGVRPTALHPLWNLAGFALGAGTALMGEKAAMACTVAVEEVIDQHYARQINWLKARDPQLARKLEDFRAAETHHRDLGLHHGAEKAVGYPLLRRLIGRATKTAIWLSERV